jgi:hypothetical protein
MWRSRTGEFVALAGIIVVAALNLVGTAGTWEVIICVALVGIAAARLGYLLLRRAREHP